MPVKKYIKRAIEVQAIQWTGENHDEMYSFLVNGNGDSVIKPDIYNRFFKKDGTLYIDTLEGYMYVRKGNYVIKGIQGEYYPCDPDIFDQLYDEIVDEDIQGVTCALREHCRKFELEYSYENHCSNYFPNFYNVCKNFCDSKPNGYVKDGYLGRH